jgi:alcohol dehydrogenase
MLNKSFSFLHHTEIRYGSGIFNEIGKVVKENGQRALIVCDAGIKKAGIIERLEKSLTESDIDYIIYDSVMPNPRDTGCEEAAVLGKEFNVDVIIGIGGGSAMDTAKAANVLLTNGGTCKEWATLGYFNKDVLPLICIPTTSGTGSEVTFEAVITISEISTKMSVLDGARLAPKIAIMDPELTLSVPPIITASTGMDALTHALEAYTCSYANPITDGLALYAMEQIASSIVKATKDGSNLEARESMMIGSLMAGIAFTNSFLGAVHSLSERIGGFYDTPHGIANSIFLPFVTEFNLSSNYAKHAKVTQCLGIDISNMSLEEASLQGVKKIFELNDILGIPKFKDVKGVNPSDFVKIAESCVTHMCTEGNPKLIEKEDYLSILNKAYAF